MSSDNDLPTGNTPTGDIRVGYWINRIVTGLASATVVVAGDETYVFMGAATSYTLTNGTVVGQRVGIKDNNGIATLTPITITGNIDGASSFVIRQSRGAYEFVWNGTEWSVF